MGAPNILIASLGYPNANIVEGFAPVMLPYQFTDQEVEAMIAYAVERLGEH